MKCSICKGLHYVHPEEYPEAAVNVAERHIKLTDLHGIVLDSLTICLVCLQDVRVSKSGLSFTLCEVSDPR